MERRRPNADVLGIEELLLDTHISSSVQKRITDYLVKESTSNSKTAELASDESAHCGVCGEPYEGTHYCSVCLKPTHVFCGITDTEREGYGMPVKCRNCAPVDLFLLMTASVLLV